MTDEEIERRLRELEERLSARIEDIETRVYMLEIVTETPHGDDE